MSEQIHAEPQTRPATDEGQETEGKDLRDPKLADDIDTILDDIDEALEENAEEFVKGYIQKGGQ
jgi:ubiquitin-like protein Pup